MIRAWVAAAPLLVGLWATPAAAACPRPTSPGGFSGIAFGEAVVATADGPKVRVHYTLEGPHAVSGATVAESVRDVAEEALTAYADWGYPLPPTDVTSDCDGDGDARYDIYLVQFNAGDGQTVGESCTPADGFARCSSFARVANNLSARYGSTEIGARTVVAHELFHAVQYGVVTGLPAFWSEGTAQLAADTLHPALDDLESFFPTFFATPERPLDSQGAAAVGNWQYATAIWPLQLSQRFGPDVLRDILFESADAEDWFEGADAALAARSSSLADAFAEFGVWNAATGTRHGAGGYPAAASYPEVPVESVEADAIEGLSVSLSTRYYAVTRTSTSHVALERGDAARLAITLLPRDASGALDLGKRFVVGAEGVDVEAGAYVVVVSSTTPSKRDNPFALRFEPRADPVPTEPEPPATPDPDPTAAQAESSSGCSIPGSPAPMSRTSLVPLVLLALALIACKRDDKPSSDASASDAGSKLAAQRIVSVGSANTETLYALGKSADVVAVDTSSLFPTEATKLPQVGYQRALSAEGVLSVKPTLVLLPIEGGPPGVLDQLKQSGVKLEVIDVPPSEEGTTQRIEHIAKVVGADPAPLVKKVHDELEAAKAEAATTASTPKVLVLYARGPGTVQAFGQKTPADRLLTLAHAQNAAQGFEGNRPISAEAVVAWAPDYIVLPARGLESLGGAKGVLEQPGLRETPAGKEGRVVPMDDLLLLGFGPRLGEAVRTLSKAVHTQ